MIQRDEIFRMDDMFSEDDWVEEAVKTQELKEEQLRLLTTDLSARLFYKPRCLDLYDGEEFTLEDIDITLMSVNHHRTDINDVRPYLRSLSTITEEEYKELFENLRDFSLPPQCYQTPERTRWLENYCYKATDFFLKHHFNFRLPKHLYKEMPKEMYNQERK